MPSAAARTSSAERHSLTPPALPRPPAWTWALTTHSPPPSDWAAAAAAAPLLARVPRGTGMPYSANSCFAWYSCRFIWLGGVGDGWERRYFEAKPPCKQRRAPRRHEHHLEHRIAYG